VQRARLPEAQALVSPSTGNGLCAAPVLIEWSGHGILSAEPGASVLIDRYEELTPALVRDVIGRTAMQKARNGGRDRD